MVGVTVFRAMFPARKGPVPLGPQQERLGDAAVFVLPNPSGRNANYSVRRVLARFPCSQAVLRLSRWRSYQSLRSFLA